MAATWKVWNVQQTAFTQGSKGVSGNTEFDIKNLEECGDQTHSIPREESERNRTSHDT